MSSFIQPCLVGGLGFLPSGYKEGPSSSRPRTCPDAYAIFETEAARDEAVESAEASGRAGTRSGRCQKYSARQAVKGPFVDPCLIPRRRLYWTRVPAEKQ